MAQRTFKPDADKIEKLRVQKGWALPDLARKAGVSNRTIDGVMKGQPVIISTMDKLAKAFGTRPDALLVGYVEEPPKLDPAAKRSKLKLHFESPYDTFDETIDIPAIIAAFGRVTDSHGDFEANKDFKGLVVISIEMLADDLDFLIGGAVDWVEEFGHIGNFGVSINDGGIFIWG